jgi:hypothetical protein
MKQTRRKIIVGVMVPVVMALIVLRQTMGTPSMNGVAMRNIEALLLTGMLLGIAVAQGIAAFRRPN